VTENLGWKWALIGVLMAATSALLFLPAEDGRSPIALGIDISGGVSMTYTVSRKELDALPPDLQASALAETIDAISRRIDEFGTKEFNIRQIGKDQFQIDAPKLGEAEAAQIREQMLQLGNLEFLIAIESDRVTDPSFRGQARLGDQSLPIAYDQDGVPTEHYEFSTAAAEAQRREAYEKKVDLRGERYVDGNKYVLLRQTERRTADGKSETVWTELPVVWMPVRPPNDAKDAIRELEKARSGKDGVDHSLIKGAWLFRDPRFFGGTKDGFTGKSISQVRPSSDRFGGRAVSFLVELFKQADFKRYTSDNLNRLLALCLNDEVWSSPQINVVLSDSVEIHNPNGGFTHEEQSWLLNCLNSGSLRLKPREASRETVGPSLGKIAITRGVTATAVAFLVTIVFMIWYYRFGGIVANIALLLNVFFTLGIVALFRATLTLPGIAGLILTIGMAVDANILVFERTREELAKGKKLLEALSAGYDRAFITILDANITTAITAALLIWHGTGPIKGFGVTLLAGIIVSMFTALFVTRAVFGLAIRRGFLKTLSFVEAIKPVRYPFLSKARPWIMMSTVLCALCVGVFATSGRAKYGLDFTGGTVAHVRFSEPLAADEVRSTIAAIKTPDGKPKYEQIEPIADMPAAAVEYDVRLRSATDVDSPEVAAFVAEKFAAIFGTPPTISDPNSTDAEGEWRIEFSFPAPRDANEVSQKIEGYRDEHDNAPFSGARIEALDPTQTTSDVEVGTTVTASRFVVDVSRQDVARGSATQDLPTAFAGKLDAIPFGRVNFIGPNVVVTLKESAIVSMTLSIIAIILYMWFRFKEVKYGLAASLALLHDVLVPLGIAVSLHLAGVLDVPITLQSIAAYLTIIGFSINDTIVIFDRVRENLGTVKGTFREILDLSLGQTLSRTILTSATVFFVVLILFTFNVGQDSPLEGFAFTMLLGVISGTYSTIFIACPFAAWLHDRDEKRKALAAAGSGAGFKPAAA
jgi:SecD/SecF fusion protein